MPIDSESIWKQEIKNIGTTQVAAEGVAKFAKAINQRVTGKLGVTGITGSIMYTWNPAAFVSIMLSAVPTPDPISGLIKLASAWETGTVSSILTVPSGSYIGSASPTTTWSLVIASIIDIPSIAVAKAALIAELQLAQAVNSADNSIIGTALFHAFKKLTATVSGLDSTPTPAGPLPLVAATIPVL